MFLEIQCISKDWQNKNDSFKQFEKNYNDKEDRR